MGSWKRIIPASILVLVTPWSDVLAVEYSLLGSSSLGVAQVTQSTLGSEANVGLGFGLGARVPLFGRRFAVEFGLAYQGFAYTYTGSRTDSLTQKGLVLPVLLEMRLFGPLRLGGGLSYTLWQGKLTQTDASGVATELDYAAAGRSGSNLSAISMLGLEFALGASSRLRIEGRYSLGLTDQDTGGEVLNLHALSGVVGLAFGTSVFGR